MVVTGNSPKKEKREFAQNSEEEAGGTENDDGNDDGNEIPEDPKQQKTNRSNKDTLSLRSRSKILKKLRWKTEQKASRGNAVNSDLTRKLKSKEAKQIEEYIIKYIRQTFGKSDSQVYDIVLTNTTVKRYTGGELVLTKDDKGDGLFIILEGSVNVITADGEIIIAVLNKGEIFGDISVIFGVPYTASVEATQDATLVKVDRDAALRLFGRYMGTMDVIDLCIRRRYLPSSDVLDSGRAYRRTGLVFLKRLAVFSDWPETAVKELIMAFQHSVVLLYAARSTIIVEQDPVTCLYVVIRGQVEVSHGTHTMALFDIHCTSPPFVFGHAGLLLEASSPISVRALDVCHVIQVQNEWIFQVASRHPQLELDLKNKSIELRHKLCRWGQLYKTHEAYLQVDILCQHLENIHLYTTETSACILSKVLEAVIQECPAESTVLIDVDKGRYEAILVVYGELVETTSVEIQGPSEDNHVQTERRLAIGDVCEIEKSVSLEAATPSVVLKIRKTSLDDSEELISQYNPLDFI